VIPFSLLQTSNTRQYQDAESCFAVGTIFAQDEAQVLMAVKGKDSPDSLIRTSLEGTGERT